MLLQLGVGLLCGHSGVAGQIGRGEHGGHAVKLGLRHGVGAAVHFNDLAQILFDQAVLAEGGMPEDPAAYVKRVNALLA